MSIVTIEYSMSNRSSGRSYRPFSRINVAPGPVRTKTAPRTDEHRFATCSLRLRVYERDNGQCQYCGTEVAYDTFHVDHLHPWYFGGTTTVHNLVVSCRKCNMLKSTQIIPEALRPDPGHGKNTRPGRYSMFANDAEARFTCPFCSTRFRNEKALSNHRRGLVS